MKTEPFLSSIRMEAGGVRSACAVMARTPYAEAGSTRPCMAWVP